MLYNTLYTIVYTTLYTTLAVESVLKTGLLFAANSGEFAANIIYYYSCYHLKTSRFPMHDLLDYQATIIVITVRRCCTVRLNNDLYWHYTIKHSPLQALRVFIIALFNL